MIAAASTDRPEGSESRTHEEGNGADGRSLFLASNRPGGKGLLDIWVARRQNAQDPWGLPENLGEPVNLGTAVNTAAAESRPSQSGHARTLLLGRAPGPEGMSDIYVTSRRPARR